MKDIDPARIEIVKALGCLEDAHLAVTPGQGPNSTKEDILAALKSARSLIQQALGHLESAETIATE